METESSNRFCEECGESGSSMIFHKHHKLPVRLGGTEPEGFVPGMTSKKSNKKRLE